MTDRLMKIVKTEITTNKMKKENNFISGNCPIRVPAGGWGSKIDVLVMLKGNSDPPTLRVPSSHLGYLGCGLVVCKSRFRRAETNVIVG